VGERGFAILALGLGARPVADAERAPAWVEEARRLLVTGLRKTSQDPGLRSAHAVALGLLGERTASEDLLALVLERDDPVDVRGHAAVALGQLGAARPEAQRALVLLLSEKRHEDLRAQAALGLSWLGSREALPLLLRQAAAPELSEHALAQVAVALGRLGSIESTGALVALAGDPSHGETVRSLGVVALGLVLDPESRSSLLRLALDANYPARTAALHELLTIL
jgi:HEAT repeat protein